MSVDQNFALESWLARMHIPLGKHVFSMELTSGGRSISKVVSKTEKNSFIQQPTCHSVILFCALLHFVYGTHYKFLYYYYYYIVQLLLLLYE